MKGTKIALLSLAAGLLAILFVTSGWPAAARPAQDYDGEPIPVPVWRNELVAPGINFVQLGRPALALDPDGYPHIVYGQNRLVHAWFDGVSWRSETVDATYTWHRDSVLAIDAAGVITISDIRNGRVFARTLAPGGSWQTAEVPLPGLGTVDCLSIALDSSGRPHVVAGSEYYHQNHFFIHAYKTPGGWTAEAVATEYPVSGPYAIALDSQDRPAILYGQYDEFNDTSLLQIARLRSGSWQHAQIATGCLIGSKVLALDRQDKAHAVFSESCDESLTYARERDSGWETKLVTYSGFDPALALDGVGMPHVVYGDTLYGDTVWERQVFVTLSGAGWMETVLQEGAAAGRFNTLIFDDAGAAHIVSLGGDLKYTTNSSGQWRTTTAAVQEIVGSQNALALDSADVPYILYYHMGTQELNLSVGGAGGWQTDLVTRLSPADLDLAIALDVQDRPRIAYVDGAQNRLVVGKRRPDGWSLESIATGGQHLSLAIGRDNRSQLILVQNDAAFSASRSTPTSARVVYWSRHGDSWVSEPVSEPDAGIVQARLALDSHDRPHVAFTADNGSFYAFRRSAGDWVIEQLPFESIDDLALGPDDALYVLHTEYVVEEIGGKYPPLYYYELRLAERSGNGWTEKILAINTAQARLAVGADNRVHVAFGDYLQRNKDGSWLFETPVWLNAGDIGLVVGQDGEPRMVTHDGGSLILSTREIRWLDKFSLMPVVAR